ncbi:MAG: dihydropteroate synthase [Pseudomonadota bacterium]
MSDTARRHQLRDEMLHTAEKETLLMGILNTTPDSFSDGGEFVTTDRALEQAETLFADGADIIDIGGESTRPGAVPVSEEDERMRTLELVSILFDRGVGPISIDTYKAAIARDAAAAGAVLINDVWGMTRDDNMAATVAATQSAVVITYNRGEADPTVDIIDDMHQFFQRAFETARSVGIPNEHIWLDPGVGFSKTLEQNFEVLRRLDVVQSFDRPVLVGLSRKSIIGLTLDQPVDQRLAGTLGAHLAALQRGARILRVHDVREHADAIKMFNLIQNGDCDG